MLVACVSPPIKVSTSSSQALDSEWPQEMKPSSDSVSVSEEELEEDLEAGFIGSGALEKRESFDRPIVCCSFRFPKTVVCGNRARVIAKEKD